MLFNKKKKKSCEEKLIHAIDECLPLLKRGTDFEKLVEIDEKLTLMQDIIYKHRFKDIYDLIKTDLEEGFKNKEEFMNEEEVIDIVNANTFYLTNVCGMIADKISKLQPDIIVGIARGGTPYTIGTFIYTALPYDLIFPDLLDKPLIDMYKKPVIRGFDRPREYEDLKDKKVTLIDDYIKNGNVMTKCVNFIKRYDASVENVIVVVENGKNWENTLRDNSIDISVDNIFYFEKG